MMADTTTTGVHLSAPQVSTAFIDCEAIRQKKQRNDATHLWSASAGDIILRPFALLSLATMITLTHFLFTDVSIVSKGFGLYNYGKFALYRSVLTRAARITCLPISNIGTLTSQTPTLSKGKSNELPG
jgi:hypothetical protein